MANALRTTLATCALVILAAGSVHADTLTVIWDANAEPVSGYAVYSGTTPGTYSQRSDVGNTTSFTMTDAVAGRRYCFAVAAYVDPAAEGPKSGEVCGYTQEAPTNTGTVGSPQAGTLTVIWDANLDPVSGYAVYSGLGSGAYSQRTDVGNTTSYTMSDAVAGQLYCFAVAAYVDPAVEGPRSAEICGYSNQAPTLANPGNQSSTAGQPVSLQLIGSDPDGRPVSYDATGLPPGVTLMSSTGFISGSGTTAGTYNVNAQVSDGVLAAAQSFTWTMAAAPTADTTTPVVSIAVPTSAATFLATQSTVSLSGTAADSAGVTRVDWASDRGGSGTAVGTTNWSVPSVALQAGANVITLTGRDPSGNLGTDVLTVTYTPPDTTAPSISITSPTAGDRYDHLFATVMLAGVAADDVSVSSVTWANSRGGNGAASGTTNWSVASIALQPGDNVITVAARDAAGNQRTDVVTVAYAAPDTSAPPSIQLDVQVSSNGRWTKAQLTWNQVDGRYMDVYRDGRLVASTRNNGSYNESIRGAAPNSYQVCVSNSAVCSAIVGVTPQ